MKITNIFLAVFFFTFAVLQYNDPDPFMWILLYAWVAIASLMAAMGKHYIYIILPGILVCLLGLLYLFPGFLSWIQSGMPSITSSMKARAPHIELVREFLGLTLALAAFIFHYFSWKKQ